MTAFPPRARHRLTAAAGALAVVAAAVTALGVAGATPAIAGCTSQGVTVLTVHKIDPVDGAPLAGAVFSAVAGNSGLLLAPLAGAAVSDWNGVVTAGLAAADPSDPALVSAQAAADAATPIGGMTGQAAVTTDGAGNAFLLARQLCGYNPAAATVTVTETAAPAGYTTIPGPVVVRVVRPQVPIADTVGIVSGPAGISLSGAASDVIAAASALDETSSFGRGTLTVPDASITVLGTSQAVVTPPVEVLPTSAAIAPPPGRMAYTGVDAAGMVGLAAVLLAGGAVAVFAASIRRRRSRGHQ